MIKIKCLGAAGEVTGSCYWLRTQAASVLVDCGLFQGGRNTEAKNHAPQVPVAELDAVVLTHAHLDHCGRLPLLAKAGYRGPIFTTPASIDFADLILHDAAKVQEADNARDNKRRLRAGREPRAPLFVEADADAVVKLFRPLPYATWTEVAPGIRVRAVEAGHMLGSASLQFKVKADHRERTIVFSGDVGPHGAAILRDPEPPDEGEVVFLESTYGDRDHKPLSETLKEAAAIIQQVVERRGKLLVPVFAVGRTQQLLYHLAEMFHARQLKPFPIYLDSPMAIQANRLYSKHQENFDEEATHRTQSGRLVTDLATVSTCPTPEDSKRLNDLPGPMLIMAGAGMCTAGRILHHLRANLWKKECAVLFVGYQGEGSLGRQLIDGKSQVRIFGDVIAVRASIHTLGGFSAHAGQSELLAWLKPLAASQPRVYLTHGEERGRQPLAKLIADRLKLRVGLPHFGEEISLE